MIALAALDTKQGSQEGKKVDLGPGNAEASDT